MKTESTEAPVSGALIDIAVLVDDLDLSLLGRTLAGLGPFRFVKLTPPHLTLLADQLEADQARSLAGALVVGGASAAERRQKLEAIEVEARAGRAPPGGACRS